MDAEGKGEVSVEVIMASATGYGMDASPLHFQRCCEKMKA
jgi:hypothetical protein